MIDQYSPYSLVDQLNPVFQYDQRHLPRLKTTHELRRYNQMLWLIIPGVVLVWWILQRLVLGVVASTFEHTLMNFFLTMSLILMPISSGYTIVTVVGPLHRLFHLGQWQLLRISGQPENDILNAKEAISQIRVWALVAVEVGLRIIIVTLFLLNNGYAFYQTSMSRDYFLLTAILNPLCWGMYLLVSLIGVVFVIEPIFRMRITVMVCIATAIKVEQTAMAILTGLGLVLPIQVIQSVLIAVLLFSYQAMPQIGKDGDVMPVFSLLALTVMVEVLGYLVYIASKRLMQGVIYRHILVMD